MEGVVVLLLRSAAQGGYLFLNLSSQEGNACIQRKISNAAGSLSLVKSKKLWLAGWPRIFIYKIGLGGWLQVPRSAQIAVIILPFPRRRQQVQWQKMQSQLHKRDTREKDFCQFLPDLTHGRLSVKSVALLAGWLGSLQIIVCLRRVFAGRNNLSASNSNYTGN
jgi:hypothetical protein